MLLQQYDVIRFHDSSLKILDIVIEFLFCVALFACVITAIKIP